MAARVPTAGLIPILVVGMAVSGALLFLSIPPPSALITARIETEVFSYRPTNPRLAEITFPAARIDEGNGAGECIRGFSVKLVNEAGQGTTAVFARYSDQQSNLVVDLQGSTLLLTEGQGDRRLPGGTFIVVDREDSECSAERPFRIPLQGELTVGAAGQSDVLRTAAFEIYGRSGRTLLGILPVAWFRSLEPNGLYLAEAVSLPHGSTVLCAVERVENASPERPNRSSASACTETVTANERDRLREVRWWGFADIDLKDEQIIDISAAAQAHYVLFIPPVPSAQSVYASEKLSMSLLAQVAGDPNLRIAGAALFAALALFAGLVQILSWRIRP